MPLASSSKYTEFKSSTEQTTDQKKPLPVASEIQTHEEKVELKDSDHKSVITEKPKLGQTGLKLTPDHIIKKLR